jgi:hypothetical protein
LSARSKPARLVVIERQHSANPLDKPHLSIVTRYQAVIFCKLEGTIKALCGPVSLFKDIPKVIREHGERCH